MTSQKTAEFGSAASSVKPIDSHARFIVVGVIVVGSFIALLNQTVMSPALPALMRDFNITTGTVQWVTSVYMLVSGCCVPSRRISCCCSSDAYCNPPAPACCCHWSP